MHQVMGFAALNPSLFNPKGLLIGCSERNALPRMAVRGRAAGDRIEPTLSSLWLPRSVIVVSNFIGPGWLPEQLGSLYKAGIDEDDED